MSNGPYTGPLSSPQATRTTAPLMPGEMPPLTPRTDDPAWQARQDALAKGNQAGVILREIPNLAVQTSWTVSDVRLALRDLTVGLFDKPSQLVDAVVGDDRVQATLGSRTGGLLGQPIKFEASNVPRVRGSDAAKECLDAWETTWPTTMSEPMLSELLKSAIMLGFSPAQVLWDTSGEISTPHVLPWQSRYTYYHWTLRQYIAITVDGQTPITPGDGHWLLHAPHGQYRGWMRGSLRAVAQPWLIKNYAYRDWARYSERHGMPIIRARTPAAGDPLQIQRFEAALATLGQESVIQVPQGVDKQFSYDLDFLEASDGAWQGFDGLIARCERSIILALLYQNLTTEVKEGSFAAARVHGDVRQAALAADARALTQTIHDQVARPFAEINFGDADLAPESSWKITPYEDYLTAADTLYRFSNAVATLRKSGVKSTNPARFARSFGLEIEDDDFEEVDPILPGTEAPADAGAE